MSTSVPLAQVLTSFETGKRPKGGAVDFGVPSLGGEHVTAEGTLKLDPMKYVPAPFFQEMKKGRLQVGDVLIVKDGATTGRIGIVEPSFPYEQAGINEHLFLLRADESRLDPRFLYFYLRSNQGQAEIMSDFRGAAQGGISREIGEKVRVPLPPLDEQRRIVDLLSRAEAIVRLRREAQKKAAEIISALFLDMFGDPATNPKGWPTEKFGNLVLNKDGQRKPVKAADRANRKGPYPYYGASGVIDFVDDFLFEGTHLLIAEDGANLLSRSTPIAFQASGRYWVNNHAHVVAEKEGATLAYLEASLNLRDLRDSITGSAQPKLTQASMNAIPVAVPPLREQKRFAAFVARLTSISQQQRAASDKAEATFNAALSRTFWPMQAEPARSDAHPCQARAAVA